VSVATYNVQNLFDFIDDPERSEGEFTPNTSTWSRGAYTAKVESIAEAIILIDADIVTLQEVESDEVLLELTQLIRQRGGRDYAHVATSSTRDQRGIRLGVLSIYPITREIGRPISESVSCANGEMLDGSRPEARPIYEVNLWSDGSGGGGGGGAQSLTLLVNHWKSRAFDVPCRVTEHHKRGALQIRDLVREWTDSDPERAVLVLGDFNATEDEEALSATLDATLSRSGDEEGRILLNLWGEAGVRAGDPTNVTTGTYRYQGAWLRLDHIFATSSMMSAGTSVWSVESFEQIRANELMLDGSPYYWSNDRREGYSDHLPLKVTLRLR
jgi:endonuclease/exonuclease/phosphatase family metal-dependent hydrolase